MKLFKKSLPQVDPLVEEARANLPILEAFRGNQGWGLVKSWCVGEVNSAIKEWTQGVPHERQLALATRVSTLGWVLDLIDTRMALYRRVLEDLGELPGKDQGDDDEKPFTDPYEPVEAM